MAEADITQVASAAPVGANSSIDARDVLNKKSAQLQAMLALIYGEGFENFDTCSRTIKDNYLWACADMAEEIREATRSF